MGENGGKKGKALKDAGFSDTVANNPNKFFKGQAAQESYSKYLDEAGLTDKILAETHCQIVKAATLKEMRFAHKRREKIVKYKDKESGEMMEKTIYEPVPVADKIIESVITSMPGCKLVHIEDYLDHRLAYYLTPENAQRAKAIEMAYKNKGHFAAQEIDLNTKHELTPEEADELNNILKKN